MTLAVDALSTHLRRARRLALTSLGATGKKRRLIQFWPGWRSLLSFADVLTFAKTRVIDEGFPDPWPGDSTRGAAILCHEFPFAGHIVVGDEAIWHAPAASPAWSEHLHAFEWLNDLHVIGSDAARLRGRSLIISWIGSTSRYRPALAQRSDILGRRICAWLGRYKFFCASAEDAFRHRVHASLARQVNRLMHKGGYEVVGVRRLHAIKGMICAGLYLTDFEEATRRGLTLMAREIAAQILPDGGHIERAPERHVAALRCLIDIRTALLARRQNVPDALQDAINRMAPMLRLFRHGDGRLAGFNGGGAPKWLTDMVLNRAEARGKSPVSAPHSGFQRLQANRTLVLFDAGPPTLCRGSDFVCAGTLSLEISIGREPMIVNCGGGRPERASWRNALRMTAAHSTLTLGKNNSSQLCSSGQLGDRVAAVHCMRNEENGNIWVEASHDGYSPLYGVHHMRRLYLSQHGGDVRGEDMIIRTGDVSERHADAPPEFFVRFHLHPAVRVSLIHDRTAALIRLPSGQGWRFHSDGPSLKLINSIFAQDDGTIRRTEQIVASGHLTARETRVRWAFHRTSG